MVVGGKGKGPGTQLLIISLEQFCSSMGGANRIPPFIHGIADGHEPFAGTPGKLPDARSAEFTVRFEIE